MIGSIFWNCWFGLFGFSFYFLLSFQRRTPSQVIIESFISGIIFFISMYFLRIFFKANNQVNEIRNETEQKNTASSPKEESNIDVDTSTDIKSDINTNTKMNDLEMANIVKQMLSED